MNEVLIKFEHVIVSALFVMMILVILVSTIELGWIILKDFFNPPRFFLEISDLLEIFGFFLLVLIGIELLETIKTYLNEQIVHVEIVLEVGLIAIARKVIILDIEKYDGITIIGVAGLILAVSAAYFVIKRKILRRHT